MGTMMMIKIVHHLLLTLPGIMGRKDRRRRNRKPWWNTQHQEVTRSSSKEVETCVRTVQLRSSPSPPRSPSVQAISVLTRVGTSCSRADRSRSHHRGSMSTNQQRGEARRSRSRSKESELPRRSSRAGSRESKAGKVQPPRHPISQPCSEKPQPALTAESID